MTANRDLKSIIRERQAKTGESYTAARAHVMRARAARLGLDEPRGEHREAPPAEGDVHEPPPVSLEAVVLKVGRRSMRVRILNEDDQVTLRASDVWRVVPGHIVTLTLEKRWTWRGAPYATGSVAAPRIDIEKLGLAPLPLEGGDLLDLRAFYEPFRSPDPYAALWRKHSAKPRACFEFDSIAWGAFPDDDPDDNATCDAAELAERGDVEQARELLMDVLHRDLRCLDAHAHLGKFLFDRAPERALVHYEVGVRIGELSLPRDFDGVLLWGELYNRPFLRCLHGYGLCLWRLGRPSEALAVFERILSLNPPDNQGVRTCLHDVKRGRRWEEAVAPVA